MLPRRTDVPPGANQLEVVLDTAMRGEIRPHWELAELAERQHGIVSRPQLARLGYSGAAIDRAAEGGRLHPLHRGVYAVGHTDLSQEARCLAAVMSCGAGALLSHRSAAWLWGLRGPSPRRVEVTTPTRGKAKSDVWLHHSTILEEPDRAAVDGVPVTAVPRTLLDLAACYRSRQLSGAIERAERLDLLDLGEIDRQLSRSGTHRGKTALRRALEIYRDPAFSRARSERLFLDLVKKARLPRPAINTFVAGHEIDAYWERERFAVEVDGWDAHRTRKAFEEDPVRQEELKLAGIDSLRITARRIEREPEAVAARLGRLLEMRRRTLQASAGG